MRVLYAIGLFVYGFMLIRAGNSSKSKSVVCADALCEGDPLGFEAVVLLHASIDDDQDGSLDRSESDEYFRDELKHEDGAARQATFHGADDLISVQDLWRLWTLSEVYNWTVEDVIVWLEEEVDLPKYAKSFRVNAVDGHILPRIAVNSNYVSSILDIKNGVHKQKLAVKATDLVLFGQKKKGHNWIKDVLLLVLLAVASGLYWYVRNQKHTSRQHVRKIMKELEGLQKSEDTLKTLQHRYEQTKKEHLETSIEKQYLEKRLKDEVSEAKDEAERLRMAREDTESEISRLKFAELELIEVRKALAESEQCFDQVRMEIPQLVKLQQWLQLSYEIETQHYEIKREAAERHLRVAREMWERIRRKRSGLFGSLRIAHSTTMDDTDQSIMQARGALEEVKLHLQERTQRWQEIEKICGFSVINNPGLHVLETSLRGIGSTYLAGSPLAEASSTMTLSSLHSVAMDTEMDDDMLHNHLAAVSMLYNQSSSCSKKPSPRSNGSAITNPIPAFPSTPTGLVGAGGGGGGLVRPYPDHRVWPNLMKAGMQLTMFGLGLTNPHLGGPPVRPPTEPRDKRRSLMDVAQARSAPHGPTAIARNGTTGHTNGTDSSASEKVVFRLGEESSTDLPATAAAANSQYGHSRSLDSPKPDRPRSLSPSYSDPSLRLAAARLSAAGAGPTSRVPPPPAPRSNDATPDADSHDSSDSLDVVGKPRKKSSLRVSKLFKRKDKDS